MKKFLALFIVFIILLSHIGVVYSSFAGALVQRIIPGQAIAATAGGIKVPALIGGVTSGGLKVSSWIPLLIPGGNVAKIAGAVVGIAGGLALDYVFGAGQAWFAAKGLNALLAQTSDVVIPNGYTAASYSGAINIPGYSHSVGMGVYANAAAAGAAGNAWRVYYPDGGTSWSMSQFQGLSYYYVTTGQGLDNGVFFYSSGVNSHHENQTIQKSPREVQSMLTTDLAADDAGAKKVGQAAVEVAAASLDSPNHPVNMNADIKAAIASALSTSLTASQLTALEGQGVTQSDAPTVANVDNNSLSAGQIQAAMQAALSGQNLSASQMAAAIAAVSTMPLTSPQEQAAVYGALSQQGLSANQIAAAITAGQGVNLTQNQTKTAVKAALDDTTDVVLPVDPSFTDPVKLSFTSILQSFMSSINSLPIMNTLRGITINASGTSNLCLSMAAKYGGVKCWNAASIQDQLNMIGTAILSIVSIVSFIYIFRG